MNCKKTSASFLLLVVGHYFTIAGILLYQYWNPDTEGMSIITNLLLSEGMVVAPVLLVTMLSKRGVSLKELAGFRKIKISTVFMTVLYTILVMPLASLLNAISMLFVDNVVVSISGDIFDVPFFVAFLLMAVFGPFCEEFVFRGLIFKGYRTSGNIFGAILLSAVLFGLMHMNFNQAPYAIALGIMLALLAEATGSTTAPFIMHLVFNGQSVCLMFLEKEFFPELVEAQAEGMVYAEGELLMTIALFSILAIAGTAIALCVLSWIAKNEGKENFLRTVWLSRKWKTQKLVDWVVVLAIILSVLYMIIETLLLA